MTLHAAIGQTLQPPDGYLGCTSGHGAETTCTAERHNLMGNHWACYGENTPVWNCECSLCYDNGPDLFINEETVYRNNSDPDWEPPNEEDYDPGPGVCSLCFTDIHHWQFAQREIDRVRRAS